MKEYSKFIVENALGVPVELTQAPKKNDVRTNTIATNDNDIYIRTRGGKLLKLTATEVEE